MDCWGGEKEGGGIWLREKKGLKDKKSFTIFYSFILKKSIGSRREYRYKVKDYIRYQTKLESSRHELSTIMQYLGC